MKSLLGGAARRGAALYCRQRAPVGKRANKCP